jgi:hypothetical protein
MRALGVCRNQEKTRVQGSDKLYSVLSVKGKKVLHIDRNDHYGGYGFTPPNPLSPANKTQ